MAENRERLQIEAQIDRYVNGELSEKEVDDLWVELIQHKTYMDYLKTSANLKAVTEQEKTPSSFIKEPRVVYAAASIIVLFLITFSIVQSGYFSSSSKIQPVQTFDIGYKRAPQPPDLMTPHEKVIRHALELYKNDEFKKAVRFLKTNLDQDEEANWAAKLDITIGVLYYNTDKFNEAVYYFKDAVNRKGDIKGVKLEKAWWYLGNAYFQLSMLDKAQQAMQKAYQMHGDYSRVAKSYLDAMSSTSVAGASSE
jgi:tetratricopeptide (TPR) repeat protein